MAAVIIAVVSLLLVTVQTRSPPLDFDWRTKGVVGPAVNQGESGSSIYFAAAGAIASYEAINTGRLVAPSVGEMQDCCMKDESIATCVGRLHGLCTEATYPSARGSCHKDSCPASIHVNFTSVTSGDEGALQKAVLINPVIVLVDASHTSFQLYRAGVYNEQKCSTKMLDHALLLVGYGSKDGEDYWICQNSWGVSWGMNGYILMARNKGNMCGIATDASYVV